MHSFDSTHRRLILYSYDISCVRLILLENLDDLAFSPSLISDDDSAENTVVYNDGLVAYLKRECAVCNGATERSNGARECGTVGASGTLPVSQTLGL